MVQFLSYEGVFTAVGGPADGLTSTDIGVAEDGNTLVGDSLQLTGTGLTYDQFTWSGPTASTFGVVNTGQTFGVVTNEPVLADCGSNITVAYGFGGSTQVTASDVLR